MSSPMDWRRIYDFWFPVDLSDADIVDHWGMMTWWMRGGANAELPRFEPVVRAAKAGHLDSWLSTPRGRLSLIIVLDQFPRNMFRGDGRTHAADGKARGASRYAVEHALDRELPAFQRMFLYMPFMHSESVEDQRRSVELFERLAGEKGAPDVVSYAVGHRDIVERFGRFPHRNEILGRETTPEEAEFLTTEGSSF